MRASKRALAARWIALGPLEIEPARPIDRKPLRGEVRAFLYIRFALAQLGAARLEGDGLGRKIGLKLFAFGD